MAEAGHKPSRAAPEGRHVEQLQSCDAAADGWFEAERDRLLEAIADLVGREGYEATTLPDVLSEASISRATFEHHFDDKQQCFLAAQDRLVGRAVDSVLRSKDETRPWLEQMIVGLERVLAICLRDPQLARVAMVEVAAVGADGRRQQLGAIARFAELLPPIPGEDQLPASTSQLAVSGVASLLSEALAGEDSERLAGLLPELVFALLCPFIGPRAAKDQVARFVAAGSR